MENTQKKENDFSQIGNSILKKSKTVFIIMLVFAIGTPFLLGIIFASLHLNPASMSPSVLKIFQWGFASVNIFLGAWNMRQGIILKTNYPKNKLAIWMKILGSLVVVFELFTVFNFIGFIIGLVAINIFSRIP